MVLQRPCADGWLALNVKTEPLVAAEFRKRSLTIDCVVNSGPKPGSDCVEKRCVLVDPETAAKHRCLKDPHATWGPVPGGNGCVVRSHER